MRHPSLFHRLGIRVRVMLLTLVPLGAMSLLLGYHLIDARLESSHKMLLERGNLIVKHLASSSEFGLFSQNADMLDPIVAAVAHDESVLWAGVLDGNENLLSSSGQVSYDELESALTIEGLEKYSPALFVMPVGISAPAVSDFEEDVDILQDKSQKESWPLGWAVVRLSLKNSLYRQKEILYGSLFLIAAGFTLSVLIAIYIGKSITDPLLRLSDTIGRLRKGDLAARMQVESSGEIGELEHGINAMAESLQTAQENLQSEVEVATEELEAVVEMLQVKNHELEVAREEALAAGQEKADFLARMSHEVRTPVSAVVGFSSLLINNPDAPDTNEYIQTINKAASQMLCVVDDILNFMRLESGNLELESIDFDLHCLLEDVVTMLSQAAHEKGLEIIMHMHSDLPQRMQGDPTKISQVLTNLLNNAIKFTKEGHVFLEACLQNNNDLGVQLYINVSDTGVGLGSQEKEKIFQAFAQADNTVNRRFGGTGLGLAISKLLVELMGGVITADGVEEKGASFSFTIPYKASLTNGSMDNHNELTGCRILFYDHHPLSRRAIRTMLVGWGVKLVNSGDSAQLASLVVNNTYDLVIMSLGQSEQNEDVVCEIFSSIREQYDGPILMLIGSELWKPPSIIDSSVRAAWCVKPVRRHILYQKICNLIEIIDVSEPIENVAGIRRTQHDFEGVRVLSVEDNEFNRNLLRYLLEQQGAQVDESASGEQAIVAVGTRNYDLIIMDLHMPGMDGAETARIIRSQLGRMAPPIIGLSADVFAPDGKDELLSVFDDYLIKPISETALKSLSKKLLCYKKDKELPCLNSNYDSDCRSDEYAITDGIESNNYESPYSGLPDHLNKRLYVEMQRLHEMLMCSCKASDWAKFTDLVHQFHGLCGLYELAGFVDVARNLQQAESSKDYDVIPSYLKQLTQLLDTLSEFN